jgi:putative transposase
MEPGIRVGEVTVKYVGHGFQIHIGYDIESIEYVEDNGRYIGGDLGLENLIATTSNVEGVRPLIVDGRELKSANQYFNKQYAKIQSQLPPDIYTSRAMYSLLLKREGQIKSMLNNAANLLADYAHANDISKVIIGKNDGWKPAFKSRARVKQSFMFIPYNDLIDAITRSCAAYGIEVICREESYTSQASLIDLDDIPTWDGVHRIDYEFSGKRISRGLYRSSDGHLLNADVNAAGNILRKWKTGAFDNVKDFRWLMNPYKVRIAKNGTRYWSGGGYPCMFRGLNGIEHK